MISYLSFRVKRSQRVVVKCTNRIIRMMRMPPGRIMWLWLQSGAQYRANHCNSIGKTHFGTPYGGLVIIL